MQEEIMLRIDSVSKKYKLGQIGRTTLIDELQRKRAKIRRQEDPTKTIGSKSLDLNKDFYALNNISFDVKKGERIGIIGHNGAGKSTLLKLISRITAPSEGTISLNGRVASMLEVGTGFHPELTGKENIYMNGAILGMSKKEIDSKIEKIIDFSECREFIDTPVKRYSSGMYVKLAFSVAAHLDSEIMIMDEVLAVGDMAFQKKCINKMNDVSRQEERTILYVSHNMNTIRDLCDRVVLLDSGKIVFDGDVEEGIAKYLGSKDSQTCNKYSFTNKKREKGVTGNIVINDIEIKNRIPIKFGENLELTIRYQILNDNINSIQFRIKIKNENGIIGTSISKTLSKKKKDNHAEKLEINVSSLAPGNYYFGIEAFTTGRDGQIVHDSVDGMQLLITDDTDRLNIINWNKAWGIINFPEIKILKIDKSDY